jgi:hydrogenase maturation factor
LHELAEASQVGLEIWADQLPYLPETLNLCHHFGLDPLGVIASGALLIATEAAFTPQILAGLNEAGITARVIGRTLPSEAGRWLVNGAESRPLPRFTRDEITRLFE